MRCTLPDPVLVLPPAWDQRSPMALPQGVMARHYQHVLGLTVLATHEDRGSGTGVWLHISLSRPNKLPSWADVREVKDLFIGRDRCAIHMVPPEEFWLNFHPYTLHLFTRLDGPTVPPALYEDM